MRLIHKKVRVDNNTIAADNNYKSYRQNNCLLKKNYLKKKLKMNIKILIDIFFFFVRTCIFCKEFLKQNM